MMNININLQDYKLKKYDFKPQTLDFSDMKRVFDRCVGERVTLDYVYGCKVGVYSCIVHSMSCNAINEGCIKVTCFKSVQPKVAPPYSIAIPCNSIRLMELFKNVCLETRDFYIYVSDKKGKIDIDYCFKKHNANRQKIHFVQR